MWHGTSQFNDRASNRGCCPQENLNELVFVDFWVYSFALFLQQVPEILIFNKCSFTKDAYMTANCVTDMIYI